MAVSSIKASGLGTFHMTLIIGICIFTDVPNNPVRLPTSSGMDFRKSLAQTYNDVPMWVLDQPLGRQNTHAVCNPFGITVLLVIVIMPYSETPTHRRCIRSGR
jgi:hypothetical protein